MVPVGHFESENRNRFPRSGPVPVPDPVAVTVAVAVAVTVTVPVSVAVAGRRVAASPPERRPCYRPRVASWHPDTDDPGPAVLGTSRLLGLADHRLDRLLTALLVIAIALSRLAAVPASVAEQDEAYLAAAVLDLDATSDRPFPPWAFGWVALGRLLLPLAGRPDVALSWLGVAFGSWLLFPLSAFGARFVRRDLAVLGAVVVLSAPGVWLLAARPLTDTAGSALVIAALAAWLGSDDPRRELVGGVAAAGALLVRPQLAVVLLPLLGWRLVTSPHRSRALTPVAVGAGLWATTAIVACGCWPAAVAAWRDHAQRHVSALDGFSFGVPEWCGFRILGSTWAALGWWALAVVGVIVLLGRPATRRSAAVTYGLVFLPWAVASAMALNGTLARYGLPLVLLSAPAVAVAASLLARAALPVAAGGAVLAWAVQTGPAAAVQRLQPSPAVTAMAVADARAEIVDATVVADRRLHGVVTLYRTAAVLRSRWVFDLEVEWGTVEVPARTVAIVDVSDPTRLDTDWTVVSLRQPLLAHLAAGRWTTVAVGPPQTAGAGSSSGVTAASSVAPFRMRTTRSTGTTKILPSPTLPVRAADTMASTVGSTKWSDTPISSRTFSTSSILTVVPR